jgi:hypothetical protein
LGANSLLLQFYLHDNYERAFQVLNQNDTKSDHIKILNENNHCYNFSKFIIAVFTKFFNAGNPG